MQVAVLGAGVAGISSAIALRQKGFDVEVYERLPGSATLGAGIVVWPNAVFVLQQLGVLEEVQTLSGMPTAMQRITDCNQPLGSLDIRLVNQHMGYPSFSILRNDLQRVLEHKLLAVGVPIHYDHEVTRILPQVSGATEVQYHNGVKIKADIIIGADGRMASQARQFVHGDNAPVYQGFINWIGVCEQEEPLVADGAIQDYWGIGQRFGIVPITPQKVYWAGGVASEEKGARDPQRYLPELEALFNDWPETVQKMITNTPAQRINKIYVHDHDPIQTWHRGNVIAIGDAAHAPLPTSGQGACQALEDAWHLAQCLDADRRDVARAFRRFTQIRFNKTTGIIMAARGFAASLFNTDEDFCRQRNRNSQATDFSKMAIAMAGGWGQDLPLSV